MGRSSPSAADLPLALTSRLRETLDNMLEGCQIVGYDWRYLYVNDAAAAHGRTSRERLLGQTMMDAYPAIEKTEMFAALRRCMEERVHVRLENEFTYPDGETEWFELSIEPVPEGIVLLSVDVSDRKRAEESLRRTGRGLKTLCSCNQAIVRATNERQLLQEVCRIIVEVAGYRLAWAGQSHCDEGGPFLRVALAGCEEKNAPNPGRSRHASERDRSRVARAIATGEPVICQDILTDPDWIDYREEAEQLGYSSSIALPLRAGQEVMGALSVYAREPRAFEQEEAELLRELADGVAHGMTSLRARARREQLDGELRNSEKRYQLHFEHVSDVIYSLDRQLRIRTISPSVRTLLGYAPEELIGKPFTELGLVSGESLDAAAADIRRVLKGEAISSSVHEFVAKDGTRRFVELSGAPVIDGEELSGVICVARDVTDRMGTERALDHTLTELRQVLGGMINTLGLIVEQRDPYTAGHQRRVANLARAIATEMGVSLGRQGGIRVAASIHDLGKVSVPAEILSRPGRLSANELKMVQAHAQIGYGLLREVEFPWPVADIVLQHHERLDGSGYPHRLSGDEILLEARIVGLADVVDAMASHRPYRPAFAIEEVMEEISRERGSLYDAQAVDACLRLFREEGFQLK
jgi:PAS domain S-box-containing protein